MVISSNHYQMQKKENKIYKSLLNIFSDEVLRDFQECISEIYEESTTFWVYDKKGGIRQIRPRKQSAYYPEFCKCIIENCRNNKRTTYCSEVEKREIENLLNEFNNKTSEQYIINKCHLGISRIIFPLTIDNKIVGALSLGKFRCSWTENKEILKKTTNLLNEFSNNGLISKSFLDDLKLEGVISKIRKFSNRDIVNTANYIINLLPFIKSQYAKCQPLNNNKGDFVDGFVFLEELDKKISDIFIEINDLWKIASECLNDIVANLELASGCIFYTDKDDYQRMTLKSYSDGNFNFPDEFALRSYNELSELIFCQRGIIVPKEKFPLDWLDDHIIKFSETNHAIAYAENIHHQKNVLIIFGFKKNVYMSDFEKILLRISVTKLVRFARNVISKLENDEVMVATGHKLRRTHGDIKGSVNSLLRYSIKLTEAKNDNQREIIERSLRSLDSALIQLDLITRNYHAFSDLSWVKNVNNGKKDAIDKIDLTNLLVSFKEFYKIELETFKKTLKFKFLHKNIILYNNELAIKLLFWNLIDNAIKFSYKDTFIEIITRKEFDFYIIDIVNRGVGIPNDETKKVFEKFYKSSYRDKSREISGQGIGLSIGKRCMDRFIPEGEISITSIEAKIKHGERRFDGDNYLTTARVKIPVKTNLYNQFVYRSQL